MISRSMTLRIFSALLLTLCCLATLFSTTARADIVSVTTTPGTAQVAVPNGSTVTFTWRVRRANTGREATQTIISNSGTLNIGGTTVTVISTTLSRVNNTQIRLDTMESFTETIIVPSNVAFQIAQNPNLEATYRRTFGDGSDVTSTGAIRLTPSSSKNTPLSILRIDLSFDDRSRVKVLPSGEELVAQAELNFDGAGMGQFEWHVAEPSSTRGALVFRRLQVFRRSLAGRGRLTLRSPLLPNNTEGLYIVRLVPTDQELNFVLPELKYFVVPRKDATAGPAGQRISLSAPGEGAFLTRQTEFSWQGTPGAAVYQLEVYPIRRDGPFSPGKVQSIGSELLIDPDELAARPITGIVVPADQSTASLKLFSLARLNAGQVYLWRIKAISGNGTVIGTSPLRRISTPE